MQYSVHCVVHLAMESIVVWLLLLTAGVTQGQRKFASNYIVVISNWPCLLTPTSGGNKSHGIAIDTESLAIRVTKELLTPTSVPSFLHI